RSSAASDVYKRQPQQVMSQNPTPSTAWRGPPPSAPAGNPLIGLLIIAGITLIAIFIIWLISRADDTSPS
ncbi:MAG: hypothetical protein N3E46_10010, partial [Gemmataceae bacterium]|nr:hypothetical protein [Gemmataceae bacterium]